MENALKALMIRGFHWYDLLDIIAVAVLIYYAIIQVRGTRAVQMVLGVLVLFVADVLSGWLGMTTTHRILQNLLFYIPFAIIVLFQQTIRRALASLGSMLFGRRALYQAALRSSQEAARACFALAKNYHGGLVIFERTQGLKNYAETGVAIGAGVTSDLIRTIFYPGTPLHDGAVIVSEGEVVAAGCFLPLSALPLPTEYGTRHRAAVGITEETDAVCVVVSEERGRVSLAVNGAI
ncbi:MAG: diadenylate cyclase CdaA, partial [Acidobacteriota bacterium]